MTRLVLLCMAAVILTGCGIRRPIMPPREIPAYEEKMRRKKEKYTSTTTETAPTEESTPQGDE